MRDETWKKKWQWNNDNNDAEGRNAYIVRVYLTKNTSDNPEKNIRFNRLFDVWNIEKRVQNRIKKIIRYKEINIRRRDEKS